MFAAPESGATAKPLSASDAVRIFWPLPFPATLQELDGRLVDVNDAYARLTGLPREQLIGRDPIELQPDEDRAVNRVARSEMVPRVLAGEAPPLLDRRIVDSQGQLRWYHATVQLVVGDDGTPGLLALLQETTAEHRSRDQAERSLDELSQWFDLSPTGMLVFDDSGLIVRSNPASEAQIGSVPVMLSEAADDLRMLLGWHEGGVHPDLVPGAAVHETGVTLKLPDGRARRLTARLRAFDTGDGRRRFMAVVEDRSAEDERDLARLEVGALMNAAGVGVATFDSQRGWRRSEPRSARAGDDVASAPAGLQSISRDLVEPGSRADYEKLQRALRAGERAEVRYAVRTPELGLRWLLTRVEPAELSSGQRATSVVTLDVTEHEVAQRRSDELLRELTTTLDGSPAGIAYLRGGILVRCNRRFERMLGFAPGAVAGAGFSELFRHRGASAEAIQEAAAALGAGKPCDVEIFGGVPVGAPDAAPLWYSLSVRRAEPAHAGTEAVAVLTDISHLKRQQGELERLLRERDLMFDLSEVGIAWVRARRVERANAAMSELTGLAPAELSGLDVAELYEDRSAVDAFEQEARRSLQAKGRYAGERRMRRRDGTLRWVQVAMRVVNADDPQSDVVCSFVDVDERQRARESLQLLAGRTRAVLDSVLVGIVTVGDDGIEWMNRSARRMFAGELSDFVHEPIGTVATAEADHPLRRTDWLARLADGQSETFECRLKARDGREFWVVGNAVATTRDSAIGRQVTIALLDIETRRQAEVSVARARASLQRVIETAPLAIALVDVASRRVLQINQMAASFFGRPLQDLVGHDPADCFDGDEAAALRASIALAVDATDGVRREITRPDAAGGPARHWDARFVHLAGSETAPPEPGQVLLVASDVTEQRVAERARFDAAIAQREMLVKEVHHRIKNNLQGVAGLLQQTAERHPEVRPVLTEAVGQVQAIAQVYGLQVGAGGPLALDSVLRAIAGSVQRTFGQAIEVQAQAGWELPEAESIPVALTLNELLSNAIKHGAGAPVRCQLHDGGDHVVVTLANTGELPDGFDLQKTPGGMFGLGLVRALLPRRSASLTLTQDGDQVVARMTLRPPSVRPHAAKS
jgi:PAS domain S-box-containing protein